MEKVRNGSFRSFNLNQAVTIYGVVFLMAAARDMILKIVLLNGWIAKEAGEQCF